MRNTIISNDEHSMEESLINLTPLIDVVFVVLISFIIIAPMIQREKVSLAKAGDQASNISPTQKQLISIQVKHNNTIYLNGQSIAIEQLKNKLLPLKKQYPNQIPVIYHDQMASFGTYQTLKNLIESCGFDEMHVMLAPK